MSKLNPETLAHIEANQGTFRFWIKRNEKLQLESDILKPIVKEFEADPENIGINLRGCAECIIDMLRWAIKQLKESTEPETKAEKEPKADKSEKEGKKK